MTTETSFILPLYASGTISNRRESDEMEEHRIENFLLIGKVQEPDLTVYLPTPSKSTGEAVIICPGGGYQVLAYDWEGTDIAQRWTKEGIAAIVLKYRLPSARSQVTPHLTPLLDAKRAMRLVRHHAEEWHIDASKIGIMGFSAGGHLAASLSTHYDDGDPLADDVVERQQCRPDFSILVYPVISFKVPQTHFGSRVALLGSEPEQALVDHYSIESQVTTNTPPALLFHAADDEVVSYENSIRYFHALREHGIPAALHIYPHGRHGFSLARNDPYLSTWIERCFEWVAARRSSGEPKR